MNIIYSGFSSVGGLYQGDGFVPVNDDDDDDDDRDAHNEWYESMDPFLPVY